MTDLHDAHDLEDLYGPLYKFSDHKLGDRVSYRDGGTTKTGTILWICAPQPATEGRKPFGVHYIVAPDIINWPDTVLPAHIVMGEAATDEPTMAHCPYCDEMHEASKIEQCPLKPHQEI